VSLLLCAGTCDWNWPKTWEVVPSLNASTFCAFLVIYFKQSNVCAMRIMYINYEIIKCARKASNRCTNVYLCLYTFCVCLLVILSTSTGYLYSSMVVQIIYLLMYLIVITYLHIIYTPQIRWKCSPNLCTVYTH